MRSVFNTVFSFDLFQGSFTLLPSFLHLVIGWSTNCIYGDCVMHTLPVGLLLGAANCDKSSSAKLRGVCSRKIVGLEQKS